MMLYSYCYFRAVLKINQAKGLRDTPSTSVALSPLFLLSVGGLCQGKLRCQGFTQFPLAQIFSSPSRVVPQP